MKFTILYTAFLLFLLAIPQIATSQDVDTTKVNSILFEDAKDSRDYINRMRESQLPSGIENDFTPAQDSAFQRAIQSSVPVYTRLNLELVQCMNDFNMDAAMIKANPWLLAQQNLDDIRPEFLIPSGQEQVAYQQNLLASQYIPFVRTINPNQFQFDLSRVATFIGLKEDVTPVITYSIDYTNHIQIVIYSVQAKVIATIFDGMQTAGKYTITWNLRDDAGKKMPKGDYIAEVRIGDDRFVRKRIQIP